MAQVRIAQDDDALAYTEVPETTDTLLLDQRVRWTFGTLQTINKHREMLFRARYGYLGCYVLPHYLMSIATRLLFLPFIAFMDIRTALQQGVDVVLGYFALFLAAHMVVTEVGIVVMRERWWHLLIVPVYRLMYEPLHAYVLYTAVYMAVRGIRAGWNKVARIGTLDIGLAPSVTVEQAVLSAAGVDR